MTEAQAKDCDVLKEWQAIGGNTLSVDDKVDNCNKLSGQDRTNCWIGLDKYLMENVVPWAPYIWPTQLTVVGKSVTTYAYDQFAGLISLVNISVNNKVPVSSLG